VELAAAVALLSVAIMLYAPTKLPDLQDEILITNIKITAIKLTRK